MYKETFSMRLVELSKDKNINQISKESGVSNANLYRYINCTREVGLEILCKLADYFDVPLDYLVGRKEY